MSSEKTASERPSALQPSALFSAAAHLLRVTLNRQFWSRQTVVGLALSLLCVMITFAWTLHRDPSSKRLIEMMLVPAFLAFLMPVFAICYGASAVGGDREDRTLIYLLITSIPRPLIYLTKFIAAWLLATGWSVGVLWVLCTVAGQPGNEAFDVFLLPTVFGCTAYVSLFLLVGAAFRHGTIISLAYWFFLEVLFGNMPGIVKRISVAFHTRCMVYESGSALELGPAGRVAREMFLPVSGETARTVILISSAILLAAGMLIFSRREYRDLS
ncbi:MAG: hypothetical protein DWQ29_03210 [Planctomycetota bacterium]|nr:MAG: hypothetical protein DWQ29_03210 [Planctomycetota bacterium]